MALLLTATQSDVTSLSQSINHSTDITLRGPLHDGYSEWVIPNTRIVGGPNNNTQTQVGLTWENGEWVLSTTEDPYGHPVDAAFMANQPSTSADAMTLDIKVTFHDMVLEDGVTLGDVEQEVYATRVKYAGYELGLDPSKTLSNAGTIQLSDTVASYAADGQREFLRAKYNVADTDTLVIFADGSILITDTELLKQAYILRSGGPVAIFGGTNLTGLNTRLGATPGRGFRDCLAVVDCPEVTQVGYNEFAECHRLSRVYLPKCVKLEASFVSSVHMDTDDGTFYGTALVHANFPTVTHLGGYALADIPTLKSVYVPSVQTIKSHAFDGSSNLEIIDFGNTMQSVPELPYISAFKNLPTTCAIVVPDALYDEWVANTSWANMASYYHLRFYKYTEWYGKPILNLVNDKYVLGTQTEKPLQPAGDYVTQTELAEALANIPSGEGSGGAVLPADFAGLEKTGGVAHDLKMFRCTGATTIKTAHDLTTGEFLDPEVAGSVNSENPRNNTVFFSMSVEHGTGTLLQQNPVITVTETVIDSEGERDRFVYTAHATNVDDVWLDASALRDETSTQTLVYTIDDGDISDVPYLFRLHALRLLVNQPVDEEPEEQPLDEEDEDIEVSTIKSVVEYDFVRDDTFYSASLKLCEGLGDFYSDAYVTYLPNKTEKIATESDLGAFIKRETVTDQTFTNSVRALSVNRQGLVVDSRPVTGNELNGAFDTRILKDIANNHRVVIPTQRFSYRIVRTITDQSGDEQTLTLVLYVDAGNIMQQKFTCRCSGTVKQDDNESYTIQNLVDCLCTDERGWKSFYELDDEAETGTTIIYSCGEPYQETGDKRVRIDSLTYTKLQNEAYQVSAAIFVEGYDDPILINFELDFFADNQRGLPGSSGLAAFSKYSLNKFFNIAQATSAQKVKTFTVIPRDPDSPSTGVIQMDMDHHVYYVIIDGQQLPGKLEIRVPEEMEDDMVYNAELWLRVHNGIGSIGSFDLLNPNKWTWVGPELGLDTRNQNGMYFLSLRAFGRDDASHGGIRFVSCWRAEEDD